MSKQIYLSVRLSKEDKKLLTDRSASFGLNQTDFIRNAIKYYNPKLTQELFDKIVNIMQSSENDGKITPSKKSNVEHISSLSAPSKSVSAVKPNISKKKSETKTVNISKPIVKRHVLKPISKPKIQKPSASSGENELIQELADELIEAFPQKHKKKAKPLAKLLLSLIRKGKSEDELVNTIGNRIGVAGMISEDLQDDLQNAIAECFSIVETDE